MGTRMAIPRESQCAAMAGVSISISILLLLYTTVVITNPNPLFSLLFPPSPPPIPTTTLSSPPSYFISLSTNNTISSHLKTLTSTPHPSGTPQSLTTTSHLVSTFKSLLLPTHLHSFKSLLSFPLSSSLLLLLPNSTLLPLSPRPSPGPLLPPYHAFSPSGRAHAPPVFVNHGSPADYRDLAAAGVRVEGCVAVVRRGGGVGRGAAVAAAAERGAVAVVMYSEGREGVERGSVGRGVLFRGERRRRRVMQRIPSMPVSQETAEMVLGTLRGARIPERWREGSDGALLLPEWRVGPGPAFLNFSYQGENKWATLTNVFATIKGTEEPDRYILLGNHRDAWTYGAVDPNSGTSVLLDIARRYAHLLAKGWRPRRTIVFCSWDAEEFGMIGSTEWVGKNLMNLMSSAVAYLNVDCAVQGPGFFASATPQLDDLLIQVTKQVMDPDSKDVTVYEKWVAANGGIHIQRLSGIDSDFAPFVQLAGVPSLDFYFGKDYPVYHTKFDSYEWMIRYGDPFFRRHVSVAEIWGLMGLHLAQQPILPFNYSSYVQLLREYSEKIGRMVEGNASLLLPLSHAIGELEEAVKEIEEMTKQLLSDDIDGAHLLLKRRILNDRLMLAERGFLDDTKQRFKHLIFGPHGPHGSEAGVFPGVIDALNGEEKQLIVISNEIQRIAFGVQRVASLLRGDPF